MKLNVLILTIAILFSNLISLAQEWRMAEVPLKTKWADKVDSKNPLPEYPRPQMKRDSWLNLNGLWQFEVTQEGTDVPFNRDLNQQILVPFPWQSALSGLRINPNSYRAWYKRTFKIPKKWQNTKTILHFGAVDFEAVVYIDGKCVGTHKGGFDPFSFDITNYLNDQSKHQLIVNVYDPGDNKGITVGKQNNSRFDDPQRYSYSPSSGIWQTVWLESVPDLYIKHQKITPDIDKNEVEIIVNGNEHSKEITVEAIAKNGDLIVGRNTGKLNSAFSVSIPSPKLWSPVSPFLYDLEIRLINENGIIDKVDSYFGMRKIAIELDENGLQKIMLNNEFLFQMGMLDQGYWPVGLYTPPSDEAIKWEILKMKEFGFNMNRHHIKIEPSRWYYWCDKLGMIVWQDMPSTFKKRTEEEKDQFEWELNKMVKSFWNHPSIVNWIVFNEHWGLYDCERLTKNIMALDPSRLVTGNSGIDAGKPNIDFEVGHIKDNHSYRPPNVPFATQKRASVCGEYGAIGYKIDGHIWDKDGPWVHHNYEDKEAATVEYERFIKMLLNFKKDGLSAAVYTQWTDLENEMNGIYTYDRKIIKLDKKRVTKANKSTYME